MKAATARKLTREAHTQQRLKQRTAQWWHDTHCQGCALHNRAQNFAARLAAQLEAEGIQASVAPTKPTAH